MDIYGYPAIPGYQYNQSGELVKQMFAHQTLSSSFDRDSEAHAMPPPTGAPWNMQGMPWGMSSPPSLVQFTAQPPIEAQFSPVVHCKRKSLDIEPAIPAKQLITEEKMAAHLNGLHISSDFTPHSLSAEEMDMGVEIVPCATGASTIGEKLKGHTIVLSEELKKVQEQPLLPASLIERLEKPRMSLVIWKPKEDILKVNVEKEKQDEEQEIKKRNGVLVPAEPGMDVEM